MHKYVDEILKLVKLDWNDDYALVIVASTTGDGDPPDNATKFWRFLRKAKPEQLAGLKSKRYAILGLGDTNYSNFCNTAKRLDRKFQELGAISFMPKGLADDATGLEAVVDPWIAQLWNVLGGVVEQDLEKAKAFEERCGNQSSIFSVSHLSKASKESTDKVDDTKAKKTEDPSISQELPNLLSETSISSVKESTVTTYKYAPTRIALGEDPLSNVTQLSNLAKLSPLSLKVSFLEDLVRPASESATLFDVVGRHSCSDALGYTSMMPFEARITSFRVLTAPKALKRVLELEVDMTGLKWAYQPGDAFGICAPNPDDLVLPLLKRLKYDPFKVFEISFGEDKTGILKHA